MCLYLTNENKKEIIILIFNIEEINALCMSGVEWSGMLTWHVWSPPTAWAKSYCVGKPLPTFLWSDDREGNLGPGGLTKPGLGPACQTVALAFTTECCVVLVLYNVLSRSPPPVLWLQ